MTDSKKTILITGATAGLGRHAALHLARKGHHVIAAGRRVDALETLKKDAKGLALDTIRLDVTDKSSIASAVGEVEKITKGRGIDVLVNNAGYGQMGPLELVTDSVLRAQFETNVFGLMAMTRAFVPQLRERGRGRIVNVSSVGGRVTFPLAGAYHATKYAVEALSDALRLELALFGLDVSIIEPGPIRTEFADVAFSQLDRLEGADRSPYAPILAKADKIKADANKISASPVVFSKTLERAVTARRPSARYVTPFWNNLVVALFAQLLPTRLADWIMLRSLGVSRGALAAGTAPALAAKPARPTLSDEATAA